MASIEASRHFTDDVLPPEGQYSSREEIRTAINAWAGPRGYAFVIGRRILLQAFGTSSIVTSFNIVHIITNQASIQGHIPHLVSYHGRISQ
ncbi:hypothetical protein HZ326_29503 [Fusarium oxysporum f. sp. albedinis]|nr:hypothetical protein HZ326_29503 [Fusarium oxysporum f. sp. albedinis]